MILVFADAARGNLEPLVELVIISSMKNTKNSELTRLESAIDTLLSTPKGRALPRETSQTLSELVGVPASSDRTEQLRLALRLLECHDQVPRRSRKQESEVEL